MKTANVSHRLWIKEDLHTYTQGVIVVHQFLFPSTIQESPVHPTHYGVEYEKSIYVNRSLLNMTALVHVDRVRPCLTPSAMATNRPIVHSPGYIWVWRATVEWYWQENQITRSLWPLQIPHGVTSVRTRASAMTGRRLTAWAVAWPTAYLIHAVEYSRERQNTSKTLTALYNRIIFAIFYDPVYSLQCYCLKNKIQNVKEKGYTKQPQFSQR
jgi:hypothetical protein